MLTYTTPFVDEVVYCGSRKKNIRMIIRESLLVEINEAVLARGIW